MIDPKQKKAFLKKCKEWEKLNDDQAELQYTHDQADQALLKLIDDEDITKAFNALDKWYS